MIYKKIILADDHTFVRKGLSIIIKDKYPLINILEVDNGLKLLRQLDTEEVDLVITDLEMPVLNGLQALSHIAAHKPELPVIMISSYPAETYACRALMAGAWAFLTKSSLSEKLIPAIQCVVSGKKYIPADMHFEH